MLEARTDGGCATCNDDEYTAFTEIVLQYIVNGAPNEVNLRYTTRRHTLHASRGVWAFPSPFVPQAMPFSQTRSVPSAIPESKRTTTGLPFFLRRSKHR